jgi:hypothetical protein
MRLNKQMIKLHSEPWGGKNMSSNKRRREKARSAEAIKEICLKAGADDAGVVEIDQESLQAEREGLLSVRTEG